MFKTGIAATKDHRWEKPVFRRMRAHSHTNATTMNKTTTTSGIKTTTDISGQAQSEVSMFGHLAMPSTTVTAIHPKYGKRISREK